MDKGKLLYQRYVSVFLIDNDKPGIKRPAFNTIGVYRLMWRAGRTPFVIFQCTSEVADWMERIEQSSVEIRYAESGPLDNPFIGEPVCTIKNIRPVNAWINQLNSLEFTGEPTFFFIHAECEVEWHLFEPFNTPEPAEETEFLRVRFNTNSDDPKPLFWPKHPYWVTGEYGGSTVIISYADDERYIRRYWPEATVIESEIVTSYVFNDRFPKPDWWKGKKEGDNES